MKHHLDRLESDYKNDINGMKKDLNQVKREVAITILTFYKNNPVYVNKIVQSSKMNTVTPSTSDKLVNSTSFVGPIAVVIIACDRESVNRAIDTVLK